MKVFLCPRCGAPLPYESSACACGTTIGYDASAGELTVTDLRCANADLIGCNWIPPSNGALCRACAMTTVTPDTWTADNRLLWSETESAKRWVLASLSRWGWFGAEDSGPLPEFHMLSETGADGSNVVVTGHASGLITINVSEADAATRVFRRKLLGERFRTVIGHVRHELSHFLFQRLAAQSDSFVAEFRALFGDEREDYAQALQSHYASGPLQDWAETHVSAYASSHPHEDWAESAAHVQHITDIIDSFLAAGLISPSLDDTDFDAYGTSSTDRLVNIGVELGIGLNHVNRSMGLPDIYPFVLTPAIREKLSFAHRWLRA